MTRTRTRRNLTPDAVPIVSPHALYEVAAIPNVDKAFYVWAVSDATIEEIVAERAIKCNLPIVPRSAAHELGPNKPYTGWSDTAMRIATRAAEQLAAAAACNIDPASSRACEVGTRGCVVTHTADQRLDQSDQVRLLCIQKLLRDQPVCWDMEIALLDRILGTP